GGELPPPEHRTAPRCRLSPPMDVVPCRTLLNLFHYRQFVCGFVEHFTAECGDHHHVFDPVAEASAIEHARLDGKHHAGTQDGVIHHVEEGRLVNGDADGVSQPMREALVVAGVCDHLACQGVDFAGGDDRGLHRRDRHALCLQ